jgi:hypothetical protein
LGPGNFASGLRKSRYTTNPMRYAKPRTSVPVATVVLSRVLEAIAIRSKRLGSEWRYIRITKKQLSAQSRQEPESHQNQTPIYASSFFILQEAASFLRQRQSSLIVRERSTDCGRPRHRRFQARKILCIFIQSQCLHASFMCWEGAWPQLFPATCKATMCCDDQSRCK